MRVLSPPMAMQIAPQQGPVETVTLRLTPSALEHMMSAVEQDLRRHAKKVSKDPAVHAPAITALAQAHEQLQAAYERSVND